MKKDDIKINFTKTKPVNKYCLKAKVRFKPKKCSNPKKPVNKSIEAYIKKNMERNFRRLKKHLPKEKNNKTDNKLLNSENLKVACIMDEIYYHCFRYDCILIPLQVQNWEEVIIEEKPDMLLVQSAWHGNNNQWGSKVAYLTEDSKSYLSSLIDYCKKLSIPTVFWNTEDPIFFNAFIEAAKLFDFIFTTDSDSIQKYRDIVKHENVFVLPFAIQPKIHNPINKDNQKIGNVAYTGTWYNNQPSRVKDMEIMINPAVKYGLDIYDRAHSIDDKTLKFSDAYKPYIKPNLPYLEMLETLKKYHIVLSVNLVCDSPTMFSQRVFEMLGCGINIVSNYALGIEKFFKNVVMLSKSQKETDYHLNTLLNDIDLRDKLALQGLREVYGKHTVRHRLETICDKVGISYVPKNKPGVSIITPTIRDHFIDKVFENYSQQNYDKKELIVILNKNSMNLDMWKEKAKNYPNVKIYKVDESKTIGYCLNYGIDRSKYEYIAKFDDDNYYGPNYLSDIMMAFEYSNADLVGKQKFFAYFEGSKKLALIPCKENCFTDVVAGSTFVFKRKVYEKIRFNTDVSRGCDTIFIKECNKQNFKIYSCDRFNHAVGRRPDLNDHTWKITEEEYLKMAIIIAITDNYKEYITV